VLHQIIAFNREFTKLLIVTNSSCRCDAPQFCDVSEYEQVRHAQYLDRVPVTIAQNTRVAPEWHNNPNAIILKFSCYQHREPAGGDGKDSRVSPCFVKNCTGMESLRNMTFVYLLRHLPLRSRACADASKCWQVLCIARESCPQSRPISECMVFVSSLFSCRFCCTNHRLPTRRERISNTRLPFGCFTPGAVFGRPETPGTEL
jgi:hypothetical protein